MRRAAPWLALVPLLGLLAFAVRFAVRGWSMADGGPIDVHAYIAMGLGVGLTLLLAGVLVGLLIYSNRRGYDREM